MRLIIDMVIVSGVICSTKGPVQLAFINLNVNFRVSDKVFPSLLHYMEAVTSSLRDNGSIKIFSQLFTCLFSCLLFSHKGHALLPSWMKASGRVTEGDKSTHGTSSLYWPWQFLFGGPAVQISSWPGPSPPYIQACRRWRFRGLIFQFRGRNGKIMPGRSGIVSLHRFSTLVWPCSLNRSAQTCGTCSNSPVPSEESGQTTVPMPSGFLRKVFSKGHVPLFPGPVSNRSSFGLISVCMGVLGDH